jgi:hypothetical protein
MPADEVLEQTVNGLISGMVPACGMRRREANVGTYAIAVPRKAYGIFGSPPYKDADIYTSFAYVVWLALGWVRRFKVIRRAWYKPIK